MTGAPYAENPESEVGEVSGYEDPLSGVALPRLNTISDVVAPDPRVVRQGRVTRVIDGDTLRVALDAPILITSASIRLTGIDAPERMRSTMREWAAASVHLGSLVRGEVVTLTVSGVDRYGRLVATVTHAAHGNVSDRMLEAGLVARHPRMPGAPLPSMYDPRQMWIPGTEPAAAARPPSHRPE